MSERRDRGVEVMKQVYAGYPRLAGLIRRGRSRSGPRLINALGTDI